MAWRWEQGRLEYFSFDSIHKMAVELTALDGARLGVGDPLRVPLTRATGLDFPPTGRPDYPVQRNFGRVFAFALLAAEVGGRLICTELCKELARPGTDWGPDDYFAHVAQRTYFPSPAFEDYRPSANRSYAMCAIAKLLIARALAGKPHVTLDEVFSLLGGGRVSGDEDLAFYARLRSGTYAPSEAERRQVRELIAFFSQLSFLKWRANILYLDVGIVEKAILDELATLFTPFNGHQLIARSQEVVRLGMIRRRLEIPASLEAVRDLASDEREFLEEGAKSRVTHLRVERSAKLREFFFSKVRRPFSCEICTLVTKHRYPWTENLLEVHHVLPLGSPVKVEPGKTSIEDLVALCPTCHRGTHAYYRKWLKAEKISDFRSEKEAKVIFEEAKKQTVLH